VRVGNSAAKVVSHPFDFGEVLRAIVVWEWDPDRDRIIASRNLPTVYGTTTLDRESSGITLVHPDDVERHQARVFTAVERGRGYRSSFRIVRPDTGGFVAIEERAEAIARGAGTSPILVGLAIALGSRR